MKSLRRAIFCALFLVLALPGRAHAQLDIQPAAATLGGERGTSSSRTLTLGASAQVKQLRCVLHELVALRPDKSEVVLPGGAVTVTCPAALTAGEPQELKLQVELVNVRSGEYSGELVLLTSDGAGGARGQQKLPIKLRVRDRWPLPLLLLIFSVLASVGVSVYRSTGKPRDEILVRLGPVRGAVQSDKELNLPYAHAFAELFAQRIGDVEQALVAGQWNDAQQALTRVEVALGRWSRYRRTWVELLHKVEEYRAQVARAVHSYPDATGRWLTQLVERAAQAETPAELRETLDRFATHVPELLALHELLKELYELGEKAEPEQRAAASVRYHELEQQFLALGPEDVPGARALRSKVDAALKEATMPARTRGAASHNAEMANGRNPPAGSTAAPMAPQSAGLPISKQEVENAVLRQRSYTWLGYLMTVSVLAAVGYQELYENNPMFGARGLADYLTVLLWGFGAEATRASVLGTASGWGLPGLSSKPAP